VLVREDSITSRSLLKNISKAPAMTWKRPWTESMPSPSYGAPSSMRWFSDVDMPRMNGSASPRRSEADKKLG